MDTSKPDTTPDKDTIIFGMTTALSALKDQLSDAQVDAEEARLLLLEEKKEKRLLEGRLKNVESELFDALSNSTAASNLAAARLEEINHLESFLERAGLDVDRLKREGIWAWSAAPLLKVVYDETRAGPDTPDTIRAAALQLAVDQRKSASA